MTILFLDHLLAFAPSQDRIVDSMLLTIVVFPLLCIFVFMPMRTHSV